MGFSRIDDLVSRGVPYVDMESDYDYSGQVPDERGHYSDKGKLPNHITFSTESGHGGKYLGGKWVYPNESSWRYDSREPMFIPSGFNLYMQGERYQDNPWNVYAGYSDATGEKVLMPQFDEGGPTDDFKQNVLQGYKPYNPKEAIYIMNEQQPIDNTYVQTTERLVLTDYDAMNSGVDMNEVIMNVENPNYAGYEDGRWYAPQGRGYDKNNRGGGIDIKTSAYIKNNPQALKTDENGRTYITEEDEIIGRNYGIEEAKNSLANRIKYAKKVTGSSNEPSEFKKMLLTDVIYNAGNGTVARTLFEDKNFMNILMNGTDEQVYEYIRDYQSNKRNRKERMRLWDSMVYFENGNGVIDPEGINFYKKYGHLK